MEDAWQVYKDESDVTADFHARREVNQFFFCKKPCNFAGRIRSSGNYGEKLLWGNFYSIIRRAIFMNNPAYDSGYLNSAKLSGRYFI